MRHFLFRVGCCLVFAGMGATALPQSPAASHDASYDASNARQPVDLGAVQWLFHEGDDPAWSAEKLDDSQWTVVDPSHNLSTYADVKHHRVFWYRLHLSLDPVMTEPAIGMRLVARAYSLYINGDLAVREGGKPGHEIPMYVPAAIYRLPRTGNQRDSDVLAIRCVLLGDAVRLPRPLVAPAKVLLGRFEELENARELNLLSVNVPSWILLLLEITVGLLVLALYRSQREQRDYLWIVLLAVDQGLNTGLTCVAQFVPFPRDLASVLAVLLDAGLMLGLLGFYVSFARRRFDWWAGTVCVCAALDVVVGILNFETPWMPDSLALILLILYYSPLTLFPFFSLVQAVRRGDREARLMLLPFTCLAIEFYVRIGSVLLATLGVLKQVPAFILGFKVLYLNLDLRMCVGFSFWLGILALVVLRSNRLSRENARIAGEVEAARQVQQVLLPDPSAQVAGFETESVYLPASQVGGDFFQLLPTTTSGKLDGGLLVVVGDVAGKGLPAAMLVSVLVGAIRTEAAHGTEPEQLLAAFNQTLLGHASGGFATCLCARITVDGEMTIANAGHLAPYLDGQEVDLPGALPLGIAAEMVYDRRIVTLAPGTRLTFYSDGVPEAQNHARELLGFDRARELSSQPAEAIAHEASHFGQTDDITVLTVTWTGLPEDTLEDLAA